MKHLVIDDAFEQLITDEAARGELPIGGALFKAVVLWVRLRRAERDGARVYLVTGQGDETDFERVETL